MKTIYIDSEFKCHTVNDGTMIPVKTNFFMGKCAAFIEGYRCVPEDCEWTRPSDGKVFKGSMIAPHTDYRILAAYQSQYETMQAELEAAYQEGVNSV